MQGTGRKRVGGGRAVELPVCGLVGEGKNGGQLGSSRLRGAMGERQKGGKGAAAI